MPATQTPPANTTKTIVMPPTTPPSAAARDLSLHIHKEVVIAASGKQVFESILAQIGSEFTQHDGTPQPLKLELWPGGRWFRDLGNNAGHLWGHVQVIKPPTLLELYGPMFMSYAAINHVQWRVTEQGGGKSLLTLTHRAFGDIAQGHREGVSEGWGFMMKMIAARVER
jgi:uncharacterized protein YndB with AHSA1/START domain